MASDPAALPPAVAARPARPTTATYSGAALVIALTLAVDRVTKQLAMARLAHTPPRDLLGGLVRLEYAENTGAFLSLGASLPPAIRLLLFTGVTGVILVGAVVAALRLRLAGTRLFGLSLVFAGGVSNLVDRVTRGSTVDFMVVGASPLRTGIFNVADTAVMLGLALFVLARGDAPARGASAPPPVSGS